MSKGREPWNIVRILAFTQIVSWGSLYYAFAIVAPDIQRELGWRTEIVFGAFSWSLLAAGLFSTPAGVLIDRFGHSAAMAVLVSTLIGPMQVAGRIGEMAFARHVRPQTVGKLTFAALPAGLLALLFLGEHQVAVAAFCMLYGISNGVLTIVRGTVPQTLFGRENYGAIAGALAGPSLLARAAGPIAAAAFIEINSSPAWLLGILLAVSLVSLGCFLAAVNARRDAQRHVPHACPSVPTDSGEGA